MIVPDGCEIRLTLHASSFPDLIPASDRLQTWRVFSSIQYELQGYLFWIKVVAVSVLSFFRFHKIFRSFFKD
jgi:hypothetical protein